MRPRLSQQPEQAKVPIGEGEGHAPASAGWDAPHRTRRRLVASVVLGLACFLSQKILAAHASALFPAYRHISKTLMGALATVSSVAPCALWDLLLAALLVWTVVSLVQRLRRRESVLPVVSVVTLVVAVMATLFVDGWALNHYAPPLADELGLEVREYSADELAEATRFYLDQAAAIAPEVPRAEDGSLERQDFFELSCIAGASYERLSGRWELFEGTTAPVKALLVWGEPLLWSGHTGIFWAPTGEAGVPLNIAVADEPFIMCHEAAHRLGLASEQEANFAAFLACAYSDDVRFLYSGYYNAFVYCFNALYRTDPDRATALLEDAAGGELGEHVVRVWYDRIATIEHYDAYEGPFKDVGTSVNDHYLKSFGEQEGVRSYGLVVDYLIAFRLT